MDAESCVTNHITVNDPDKEFSFSLTGVSGLLVDLETKPFAAKRLDQSNMPWKDVNGVGS